jgi:hypothetical protein
MTPTAAGRPLALLASLALAGAVLALAGPRPARAEPPTEASLPRLIGLEIGVLDRVHGEDDVTESVARRVLRHLTPALEDHGYLVERVVDAKQASREGSHDLALHLRLDSRRLALAQPYDDRGRAHVDAGVEIWGRWTLWSSDQREKVAQGHLGRVGSRVQEAGLGRPVIDDEEAVSRVFANAAMDILGPWIEYVEATPPEYRPKK